MKSYKLNQSIEKNLYPIETKIDELNNSNRKYLTLLFTIYAPAFISAILTVVFSGSILPSPNNNSSGGQIQSLLDNLVNTWWGKALAIIIVFVCFSLVMFFVFLIFRIIAQKTDRKGSPDKRDRIASVFYRVIIPEMITAVGLFERAYETEIENKGGSSSDKDAETIVLNELQQGEILSNKASLYYYEAFYQFKLVNERIKEYQIVEYKGATRSNLQELYKIIGKDALIRSISICHHCVTETCKRVELVDEDKIKEDYAIFLRNLKK